MQRQSQAEFPWQTNQFSDLPRNYRRFIGLAGLLLCGAVLRRGLGPPQVGKSAEVRDRWSSNDPISGQLGVLCLIARAPWCRCASASQNVLNAPLSVIECWAKRPNNADAPARKAHRETPQEAPVARRRAAACRNVATSWQGRTTCHRGWCPQRSRFCRRICGCGTPPRKYRAPARPLAKSCICLWPIHCCLPFTACASAAPRK